MFFKTTALTILLSLYASVLQAVTFTYDVKITDISGEGEDRNIGFFQTGTIGDTGTGSARIDTSFPSTSSGVPAPDDRSFSVTFPGVASALWLFNNPMIHDPFAGTVKISGSLGGLTDFGATDFISASTYEFIWQGPAAGSPFATVADYENFMSTATMSGFISGFMFVNNDLNTGYLQRIDFDAVVAPIPLPGGALFLLSALGLIGWRFKAA